MLNKEDFMMELEKALVKEKYNQMANPKTDEEEELVYVRNTFQMDSNVGLTMSSTIQEAGSNDNDKCRKRKR